MGVWGSLNLRQGRSAMPTVAELMRALPDEREALAEAALREPAALRPVPTGRWRRLRLLGTLQARIAAAYLFYWVRGWFRRADQKFFFSSRRRHTRWNCDWSSDVCSSDLNNLLCALAHCLGLGWRADEHAYRLRSEERRVGKECRSRWAGYHEKKKFEFEAAGLRKLKLCRKHFAVLM